MISQFVNKKIYFIIILLVGLQYCGVSSKKTQSNNLNKKPVLEKAEKYFVEELAYKKKIDLREQRRDKTKNPAIKNLSIPDVTNKILTPNRVVLNNGMTIYMLKNNEIPVIHLSAYIKMGNSFDPPKKAGLTALLAGVLRSGGIKGMKIARMNRFLNDSNILIHTSVKDEIGIIELKAIYDPKNSLLKANFVKACKIFAKMLQRPKFNQSKIRYRKRVIKNQLKTLKKDPYYLANQVFLHTVYGKKHPLAQLPSDKSIDKIRIRDLKKWYKKYYHPNSIVLTVNGNFNNKKMIKMLHKLFGKWKRKKIAYPKIPFIPIKKSKSKYLYQDISQSTIILGHRGIKPDNADYFTLLMINEVLGGTPLSNMLFGRIRSQLGLVYYIESYVAMKFLSQGLIKIECQTNAKNINRVIDEVKIILHRLVNDKISVGRLEKLKKAFISSIISSLNTSHKILHYYAIHDCYGLSPEALNNLIIKLKRITVEDFQRVAKQYFHPDNLIIVVVGKKT